MASDIEATGWMLIAIAERDLAAWRRLRHVANMPRPNEKSFALTLRQPPAFARDVGKPRAEGAPGEWHWLFLTDGVLSSLTKI